MVTQGIIGKVSSPVMMAWTALLLSNAAQSPAQAPLARGNASASSPASAPDDAPASSPNGIQYNGGPPNMFFNGTAYLVQQLWVDADGGYCALRWHRGEM